MFETTDGWVGDMCQASNFTHVSSRWQRLVFQKKKVWTMRRRLSWGPICAGSMPHFGSILDPVNSHFRAFSSQTLQTVPAKQRCSHQLFCTSNGDSHQTFQQQPAQISPTYGGEEPIIRQWETQKCEVTAVLFGHFEDPGSETAVYKPGTNCECTTVLLDHSQTNPMHS